MDPILGCLPFKLDLFDPSLGDQVSKDLLHQLRMLMALLPLQPPSNDAVKGDLGVGTAGKCRRVCRAQSLTCQNNILSSPFPASP